MALTLEYIKSHVENFASTINIPNNLLPAYGKSLYGTTSYININDKGALSYIVPGERLRQQY